MIKSPIFIDITGTTDDFIALALASKCQHLQVSGISVWGKEKQSAQKMANGFFPNVDVCAGLEKPLLKSTITPPSPAENVPFDTKATIDENISAFLLHKAVEANKELIIVALGPLTNIAATITSYPEFKECVKAIIIAGGSLLAGDTTPAAERNFACDPEAAQIVMASDIPVFILPIDTTKDFKLSEDDVKSLDKNEINTYIFDNCINKALRGVPAILYTEDSSLFTTDDCFAAVETRGFITRGKLVSDCFSDIQIQHHNATMILDLKESEIKSKLISLL